MRTALFVLAIIVCFRAPSQTGPGAMLPSDNEVPGWRISGDLNIFSNESIARLINEEANLYREYGLKTAVSRDYYNYSGKVINVQVFTMDNTFGSCGLFMMKSKGEKVFNEFGNACYEKPGKFSFWKHYYYIVMSSLSTSDTILNGFRQIAGVIDSKIKSRGMMPGILGFSADKTGNVIIFRGPLALSNIYYFSPLNIFNINEGIAIENDKKKEIILKYQDNNEAVRRFSDVAGILSSMSKFSDFIMAGEYSFAMRDKEGKILSFRVVDNCLNITIK
jgi:hypothetical protein